MTFFNFVGMGNHNSFGEVGRVPRNHPELGKTAEGTGYPKRSSTV